MVRAFMLMVITGWTLLAASAPGHAQLLPELSEAPTCQDRLFEQGFDVFAIVRRMADYKAALDAGYQGCREIYPEQFKDAAPLFEYWSVHAKKELDIAGKVLRHLTATRKFPALPRQCDEDQQARAAVVKDYADAAAQQYNKAFQRRYNIISASQGRDFDRNDSCKTVLESLEQYQRGRTRHRQLRHVLYTLSHHQSGINSETEEFRLFSQTRDLILKNAP